MLEQAPKDFLTGFFQRDSLKPYLEKLILDTTLKKKWFSLALIDLDRFKRFNDKYGHPFGDEILKYAVSTLRLTFQGLQCYFFRYGGDEFVVVFPEKESKEALNLLRRCTYNLRHRLFLYKNKFYKITFSIGIACFPSDGKTQEGLLKKADDAMYFSKNYGRNLVTLAGRIKYLKIRNVFIILGSIFIVALSLFISYQFIFKDALKYTFRKIESMKIITKKPVDLDTVVLKSGEIFEGKVLEETNDRVVFNLYLQRGEGTVVFKKEELSSIKYGGQQSSQEKGEMSAME